MSQQYRYPGAQPFTLADQHLFFGRDRDALRLSEQIRLEQMIVLYGKSGLGKSSLLNAAVLPQLIADKAETGQRFLPIPVRFGAFTQNDAQATPLQTLLERLDTERQPGAWPERFGDTAPLWQRLKGVQQQHPDRPILLVLDQFEELFTYPQAVIRDFASQLAQALYERIPQACRKLWESGSVQLDEKEKEAFFKPLPLKILFAIRSDRMSYLDSLKTELPNILHKTYELLPLNRTQAEEAIVNPAYLRHENFVVPPFDYSNEALDKMLDFLSADGEAAIESTQLQIICQHAERLVEQGRIVHQTAAGIAQVFPDDLGDLSQVYRSYYDAMLSEIDDEEERLKVRRLIEEDLIFEPDKRRISLYEGIIQRKGISEETLRLLIGKHHILRAEPNMSGGYTYELSHDTLVEPILEAKHTRVAEEQRREQEVRRREAEVERRDAERRAEEAERKAVEEAQLRADAERGQRRARIFSLIAAVIAVLAIATGAYALKTRSEAQVALQTANDNLKQAYEQQIIQNDLKIERYRLDQNVFTNAGESDLARDAGFEVLRLSTENDSLRLIIEKLGRTSP